LHFLESTLKRHGYYCRSRRAGRTSRSRSCISCAGRKARCDNRRPACSRCLSKAIECHYPANTAKDTGSGIQSSDDATTEQREVAPSFLAHFPGFENRQEASDDGVIGHDSAPLISNLEFANIGEKHPDWDDLGIDFVDFLNTQTNDEMVQCLPTPSTDYAAQVQHALVPLSISIPSVPTCNVRSLIHRPNMNTGTSRTVNLILHTLKSYPLMIQRHNTLPPFIHPRLVSPEVENNAMEPLTNCINLVHMISHGVHGSRKLFWENVQLECERICIEVR
jgi:hypothetical protein